MTASALRRSSRSPCIGGAFGFGLKRNVLDLYKFASRQLRLTRVTRYYAFGFSRGAFTIRMVDGA